MAAAALGEWLAGGEERGAEEEEEIVSGVIRKMPPLWQSAWREVEHTEGGRDRTRRRGIIQQLVSKMTLRCARCQGRNEKQCEQCGVRSCGRCTEGKHQCRVCGTERGAEERDERKRRQDEIGCGRGEESGKKSERRAYGRRGINIHRLGEAFVEEVTEMRRVEARGSGETEVGEELEFLARVRGWSLAPSEEEHSERTSELLGIEKEAALCRSVVKKGCILHIPASHYPRETPKYQDGMSVYAGRGSEVQKMQHTLL
jgi:hypothetical protein